VQSPAPLTHSSHSLRLLRKEQKTDARDEWLNYLSTKPGQAQPMCGGQGWYLATPHSCKTYWVPDVVQSILAQGYGVEVPQGQTVKGDIAVQDRR